MSTPEQLHTLLSPVADALELELFDVQVGPTLVRVLVDRPGGVDLEAIAEATRRISAVLDEYDPLPSRYTLEVSSPGVERPLRTPSHFHRAVGDKVKVKALPGATERRIEGRLTVADEEGILIETSDDGRHVRIAYDEIDKARTVFEWDAAPKPGAKKRAS